MKSSHRFAPYDSGSSKEEAQRNGEHICKMDDPPGVFSLAMSDIRAEI